MNRHKSTGSTQTISFIFEPCDVYEEMTIIVKRIMVKFIVQ